MFLDPLIIILWFQNDRVLNLSPVVLRTIVEQLPITHLPSLGDELLNLKLAEEEYYLPVEVYVLLGADVHPYLLDSNSDSIIIS